MSQSKIIILFAVLVICTTSVLGFTVPQPNARSETSLNFFGGLAKAFENEDVGDRQNAGLSNGPNYNDNVTINGKKVPKAVVGQKLTVVAGSARVKIPVNCSKGNCGTCTVSMNGKKVRACQTSVGTGKCAIRT